MSPPSGRAHYVRHNAVTRLPRSYVYLDTESRRVIEPRREVQTFRLAVAAYDTRSHRTGVWRERDWHRATDTAELWEWITSKCKAKARTVLVAHNLAYDLRISNAFTELPALGWVFVAGRVDGRQAWMIFRCGDRTLVCVDSLAWLPVGLEHLGELVGLGKVPLPDDDGTDAQWWARCVRDVEILGEVWRRLVEWIEREDLGNWKMSGAGQSWAAFRHRFMAHKLLVHDNDDARTAERHAAHTGRCEAWQHGKLVEGPFTEWDFTTAYARIGVECALPICLSGEMVKPTWEKVTQMAARRAVLCEVTVTTDEPVVPCRTARGIVWPVGTFATSLWENELALLDPARAVVTVDRAWVYRRAPVLAEFCGWVLDGLEGRRGVVDPVVLIALKHWSRAIIGRTAAQWTRWEVWGAHPESDVSLRGCFDAGTGEAFQLMQLGRQLIRQTGRPESPDAMVAIMSWVMAECRVRLWEAMQLAGLDHVTYVDTDSLITTAEGSRRLRSALPEGLRVKGEWASLDVLGPRQIIPNGRLRAAGIPRDAVQVAPATWEATVWASLARSIRSGQSDRVEVATRTFVMRGTDRRRRHVAGSRTAPVRLDLTAVDPALTA